MGRTAELVPDDAKRVAVAPEPQHRAHEVAAAGAEHPGGAQDRVARAGRDHRLLAGKLGPAIGAARAGRIILAIEARPVAGEDIVGGDMNDWDAGIPRGAGQQAGRGAVDLERQRLLVLGLVHLGYRRRS